MNLNHRTLSIVFLSFLIVILMSSAAFILFVDPYWIWRTDPHPYLREKTLSNKARLAKALQVVSRQPSAIIFGSSRAYYGLDPRDVDVEGTIYNFAIPSPKIREIDALVHHAIRWTPVRRILLAMDYQMFDPEIQYRDVAVGSLRNFQALPELFSRAYFSRDALTDAIKGFRPELGPAANDRSEGAKAEYWRRDGFKVSSVRTAEQIQLYFLRVEKEGAIPPERAGFEVFSTLLEDCQRAGIEVSVFTSPQHPEITRIAKERGIERNYQVWVEEMRGIAKARGVRFCSFEVMGPARIQPSVEDESFMNAYFYDPAHYSTVLGRTMFQRLGWRRAGSDEELTLLSEVCQQ